MPIPVEEFEERVKKTRKRMEQDGLNVLIAYSNCKLPGNVQYLSNYAPMAAGYQSIGGLNTVIWGDVVVALPIDRDPVLFTNCAWISGQIKDIATIQDTRVTFDYAQAIADFLGDQGGKIGIDGWGMFPAPIYERLKTLLPDASFQESMILEELRMIKSPAEIELIRRAARLADEGVSAGIDAIKEGNTELDVTNAIESTFMLGNPLYGGYEMRKAALSLIGSGRRTAIGDVAPLPTMKKLRKGDLVVMDVCPEYEGYAGDISRAKVLGTPTKEQKDLLDAVMQVREACLRTIRPRAKAKEIQDTANRVGRELGYERVGRIVSHGIGLEIHERPDAGVEETELTPNMVLSCEPALCTETLGIRIEDMVLVTETGREILTKLERTLEI